MARLIAAVALFLALAVSACGGGASAPSQSPTPTAIPDGYPPYASVEDAVAHAVGRTHRDLLVLAEPMTAQQAADRTRDLGVGGFPMIKSGTYECPPYAPCPYPGESADSRGWLIITRDPASTATGTVLVNVIWRSDLVETTSRTNIDLDSLSSRLRP